MALASTGHLIQIWRAKATFPLYDVSTMQAIKTTNISKSYGIFKALDKVSFSIGQGEVIGLLGPNGAGKTTLMKILTGYLQPTEGSAIVAGHDVVAESLEVQRRIGYLPESAPLYHEMIVQEYLQMMADLRLVPTDKRRRYLSEAIYATGLEEYLRKPIGALSKGYRQRVGIAQAILHKPDLLILDEPTSGLDPAQIVEIRELIRSLAEHATVILSTHILSEVEHTCERVLMIARGTLRKDSSLVQLRLDSSTNAAIVRIERSAKNVKGSLEKVEGILTVAKSDALDSSGSGDFSAWRVTAKSDVELGPLLYEALKKQTWKVAELRQDATTLETVFRELAAESASEVSQ